MVFSHIPILTSMILGFSKYGKITISPIGMHWPFQQFKTLTLSNQSHIRFIHTNNRTIRKWLWARGRKWKSSLIYVIAFHINKSHSTISFFWLSWSYQSSAKYDSQAKYNVLMVSRLIAITLKTVNDSNSQSKASKSRNKIHSKKKKKKLHC